MPMTYKSHYFYLEANFVKNMTAIKEAVPDLQWSHGYSNVGTHGEKCYPFMGKIDLCHETKLHPFQVAFLYLLSHYHPFCLEVSETGVGDMSVEEWVRINADRFRSLIAPAVEHDVSKFLLNTRR